ncbi:MAG: hypothetical protein QW724_06325 [Nitrososphaerota archaeon]
MVKHFPKEVSREYLSRITNLRDAVFDETAINESIFKPALHGTPSRWEGRGGAQ